MDEHPPAARRMEPAGGHEVGAGEIGEGGKAVKAIGCGCALLACLWFMPWATAQAAEAPDVPSPGLLEKEVKKTEEDAGEHPGPEEEKPHVVVVTAERLRGAEAQRLGSVPVVAGVDRKDFESRPGARRTGDVVDRLPDVYMGGPPGMNKDIRLRGMDKEFTRLEFGGVQLPGDETSRAFQVNRLSPLSVGRFTVLRNPTAEYESDGIAGRVLAEPRDIPDKRRIELEGSVGGVTGLDAPSANEIISIGFGIGERVSERFGFNLFVDHQRAPMENDKDKRTYDLAGVLTKREKEEHFLQGDIYNVAADLAYFYGRGEVHLRPLIFYLDENSHRTLERFQPAKPDERELPEEVKHQSTGGLTLANTHQLGGDLRLESDASYYGTRATKDNTKPIYKDGATGFALSKTALENGVDEDSFWQLGSKLIAPFELGLPQEIRAGFAVRGRDRSREQDKVEVKPDGTVTDKGAASDDFGLKEDYFACFLQDTVSLTERLSLTPGVRVERVLLGAEAGNGTTRLEEFTDVNPSLHLLFRGAEQWSVHAAVSRTVNRPAFDQLCPFVDDKGTYYLEGNPSLEPARSWNFDLGAEWVRSDLMLGVNLFHKEIDGVIEEQDTGEDLSGIDVYRFENTGDGWLHGIELEQRLNFALLDERLSGLELWANQAFLDSRLKPADGGRRPINNQPDFITNFGLDYTFPSTRMTIGAAAKYVGEFPESRSASGVVETIQVREARWTLDLGLRRKVRNGEIYLDALNILDGGQERRTFTDGELTLRDDAFSGRTFMAGFRVTF